MSTNTVTLIGNLTNDVTLRYTTGGSGVASFGLAVTRRYQQNNEWVEATSFFNVVCWGDLGENAAATLTKGTRAIVTGRLEQRQYEKDGDKRSVVEVVADEVGPSLRWATAQVERTERSEGFSGGSGGASGGGSGKTPGKQPDPIYGTEEPF